MWLLREVFRIPEPGEEFESTVDDKVEEFEVFEFLDALVLVDELDDDILRIGKDPQ